eukprot:721404-Amphidinium_carterae.1
MNVLDDDVDELAIVEESVVDVNVEADVGEGDVDDVDKVQLVLVDVLDVGELAVAEGSVVEVDVDADVDEGIDAGDVDKLWFWNCTPMLMLSRREEEKTHLSTKSISSHLVADGVGNFSLRGERAASAARSRGGKRKRQCNTTKVTSACGCTRACAAGCSYEECRCA